ncbi:AbfB domain-containing protein [Streptomyces yaanensis]|uniref:AbfB domain-containing protein n=1 Tax=Streptomyces yaanensis TaxID=1142239 RepID=A0ABV7SGS0_9ACTN|nr:AbfB domain-containing protein [Streptomyces sp. CGMCC 4.7035]WNC01155.1 AbfB domain-containing protein [Streptomyces sp. CGMCC 4.7035]
MSETNPPPAPDQPVPSPVWETGETPGEARPPGTRRLWAAGLLAVAVFSTSAIAISLLGKAADGSSPHTARDTAAALGDPAMPDVSLPASPLSAPSGKSGMTSAQPSRAATDSSPSPLSGTETAASQPAAHPSKSASDTADTPHKPTTSTIWKSVRSVNYPDRYWDVRGDYVKLDPVGSASARQNATFKVVKGLADASCYSFATADGTYLRHRNFLLRAEGNDGSTLFKKDATFCPRSSSYSGAVMLESANYPGRFLRHQNFQLRLDPYQYSDLYQADSAFRLVDGLA